MIDFRWKSIVIHVKIFSGFIHPDFEDAVGNRNDARVFERNVLLLSCRGFDRSNLCTAEFVVLYFIDQYII